ncbi:hypothetical protein ACPPVO_43165 [Dactylosporangium sp. McL0621]
MLGARRVHPAFQPASAPGAPLMINGDQLGDGAYPLVAAAVIVHGGSK